MQLEEEQVTQKELTSALVRLADKMGSNDDAEKVKIDKMANDMKDMKDKIGTLTNLLLQQQQHRQQWQAHSSQAYSEQFESSD